MEFQEAQHELFFRAAWKIKRRSTKFQEMLHPLLIFYTLID